MNHVSSFTEAVCMLLLSVPEGCVVSYGQLATAVGVPRGARSVVRVLRTQSVKLQLPWHRVVSRSGEIVITDPELAMLQRELLRSEGVPFLDNMRVDLSRCGWDAQTSC